MTDYNKYDVPSPDDWHAPYINCRACDDTVVMGEMTIAEMLKEVDKHDKECVPKPWTYYRGYRIDGNESWYREGPVTDSVKAELTEESKNLNEGCLVKFEPREW
ncbi:hypothetical protein SEA_ANNADREAMY_243 [Streptomyces phage Annadreamy]|uniref:Uncharacterized protein n=2 Tax=Annadreamyvirus annadreamy TaxID=2846392 RepID=A0A345GTT1_9CAUD|nr:hypothetical protein HWB75_gp036 [Streptomyces phage Annadreamy]AXG66353.1 hypothetical protein SEA_ANNADREAMY_243 [Streptomyces phage Annadreamy]QGH79550.1 hypothetical protein SEA_LIMPID_249 [Streptomyces phage Limpid]